MKKTITFILVLLTTLFWGLASVRADSEYDLISVNDLPETSGSFYSDSGTMGTANFIVNANRVVIEISYNEQTYYVQFYMTQQTDMQPFINNREVFYYTDDAEPFVVINLGDYSFFLPDGRARQTFNPHIIWNLATNELQTIDRFQTYLYSELESGNNAYAYFYVDEFVIDHLLSISLRYRFKYLNMFNNPSGDWQEKGLILENDHFVETEALSWQIKYFTASWAANMAISFVPGVGLPLAAVGTLLTSYLAYLNVAEPGGLYTIGSIDAIEKLDNPKTTLINKLNTAYATKDPDFNGINEGYNIFKLHLGQFNKPLTKGIQIDETYEHVEGQQGINIIEFTYMTEGQIYTQKGGNIEVVFTPGPGTTVPDKNDSLRLLIAIVIVILIFLAAIRVNAFRDAKTLGKFALTLALLAVLLYVVYILITTGTIFTLRL